MLDQGLQHRQYRLRRRFRRWQSRARSHAGSRERGLPLPISAVLMSPWTDLAATGMSYVSRAEADRSISAG